VRERYLLTLAAGFPLLIDAACVENVASADEAGPARLVDLERVLGGASAGAVVVCQHGHGHLSIGVSAVHGLVQLSEADFAPLPALIATAAGHDVDAMTRAPVLDAAHGFRLTVGRSSEP
jgi:hypothetical protein